MTRDQLIARLDQLMHDCLDANECAAAAVLATLMGALHAGQGPQLQEVARAFSAEAVRSIKSRQN